MRKLPLFLVALMPALLTMTTAPAQETSAGVVFSRYRQFRIPFNAGGGQGRLKQLQLFVSGDQGRSWQPSAIAPPDQGFFRFTAERDGYLWFTVQTMDLDGRLYPQALEGATPNLKVVIDTQPPLVSLQPLAPRNNEVGVSWEVRDDNLDLSAADALRLEYRSGGALWSPVATPPGATQVYWVPQNTGPIEVRLRARDRAGNTGEATTSLNAGGGGFAAITPPAPPSPSQGVQPLQNQNQEQAPAIANGPTENELKLVGSTRINLNYELKEVGPSGVAQVELWFTQNGRSWNKYTTFDDANQKNFIFEIAGEGIYGITLVARSGVGLGERPPQIGDRPQLWIEVDTTKPQVQLHSVQVGTGQDKGKLKVAWTARDKNLAREPITIRYAEQLSGPWSVAAEKLPNSGQYIWTMPQQVPYQFHLRVEALDRAGNIGEAATDSLIKVDLAQPKVKILTVEPAGK